MTIAAGVQFAGGVLLCADTQYSGGSIKFFDTKLSRYTFTDDEGREQMNAVVAASGTDVYMQSLVRVFEDAIFRFDFDQEQGSPNEALRRNLETALGEFYQKHIFKHPHYGYTSGPFVELLLAMHVTGQNACLFRTSEAVVEEIPWADPVCVFIGSGGDVASQAVRPLLSPDLMGLRRGPSFDEAILLACHALRIAKQNDAYCGGDSEFAVLFDDGSQGGIAHSEIMSSEKYSEAFDQVLRRLFFSVANGEKKFQVSDRELESLRAEQQELIERRRLIRERL